MSKQVQIHKVLYLKGMTCTNCEQAVSKAVSKLAGVMSDSVKVSYKKSTLEFEYDQKRVNLSQIRKAVKEAGYESSEEPMRDPLLSTILKTVAILSAIFAAYYLLNTFGILNLLVPSRVESSGSGLGALFIIGLATSVHCVAMCGGISLTVCLPHSKEEYPNKNLTPKTLRAPLTYNLGRIISYTVIGAVLGGLGALAGLSFDPSSQVFFQGFLKILAGIFMVIMGLSMLNLFPGIRRFVPRIPNSIRSIIPRSENLSKKGPFVVGILNGFMPCGPLQSIQIVAFATANPLMGAASMFMFSLGTTPLMLGFGSLVSTLGGRFSRFVTLFGAGLVVVLGLAMLSQGGALSGLFGSSTLMVVALVFAVIGLIISLPYPDKVTQIAAFVAAGFLAIFAAITLYNHGPIPSGAVSDKADVAVIKNGVQVVESELLPGQYPTISVKEGIPVRWNINAEPGTINGCNNRILIREYGIEYSFKEGENIIEFTPSASGTVEYSCWMGMIPGQILVGK